MNDGRSGAPELPAGVTLRHTLAGHEGPVTSVAFDPLSGILASGGYDKTARTWDPLSGNLLNTLSEHGNFVYSVAFDSHGILATACWDNNVRLWKAASGELLSTIRGHKYFVNGVAFDRKEGMLASGGSDKTVRLWKPENGEELGILRGHRDSVTAVAFDPSGKILASGSDDCRVALWDIQRRRLSCFLEGHTRSVWSVPFHPDGSILASASNDSTIRIWEPQSGKLLRILEGHTAGVETLAFSPDGGLLASKSLDNTVRLWRCDTWESVVCLPAPTDSGWWLPAIAFHPTKPLLATGRWQPRRHNGFIDIWELDYAKLLERPAARTVTYTSAKVVLVGESNVGKSHLAHRIAIGKAPEPGSIQSTHGMKFWPLRPEQLNSAVKAADAQQRDVVIWDMGGQNEYRLIHQLFLHDTTVALVLLDPTRGKTAVDEVEAWNRQLQKHLAGRGAAKFLVGAKLDQPSAMIDRAAIERLLGDGGFRAFYETSAITGRGLPELCAAVEAAIDWGDLARTSRPELFQRIRDEIEGRRRGGEVVLHVADLHRALSSKAPTDEERRSVQAVAEQLALQGVIARSRVSTLEPVLVLQVQEIERYGGSLIIAARNNPHGVPALELQAIGQPGFALPGIAEKDRLPRSQERPVLECTVQLLLEHGICFQHEGLLIFPTLFAASAETDGAPSQAASLYYDFAGAIDNIYASLVAWLVLARDFGKVRLSAGRAEFQLTDGGLCGLRKISRPGGFAHVDVYFEPATPAKRQAEFITFVEEHLRQHGVKINEHMALKCLCGHDFQEETLRQRIARAEKSVRCPVCDTLHSLTEGAVDARRIHPHLERSTWALKTEVERRRKEQTKDVVDVINRSADENRANDSPIRILHLSDLHFTAETSVEARLQPLLDDIRRGEGLGFRKLDYLVVSGDFTNKGALEGFGKAYEFVSKLTKEFGLTALQCVFVPGNHDLRDLQEVYDWRGSAAGLKEGEFVQQGNIFLVRNAEKYPLRLKAFSDGFHHQFLQKAYPSDVAAQGSAISFPGTSLQFLTFNSCWQIDQFHRKRAGIHPDALANALRDAQKQEDDAIHRGDLQRRFLRIAVWHHAVGGTEQMRETDFLGHLQNNGVRIALHGDVHEMRRELIRPWENRMMHIAGAGSFASPPEGRPEATPRLYNLLEIRRDLTGARVHTRRQVRADGPWDGYYEWPDATGRGRVPFYDIHWAANI